MSAAPGSKPAAADSLSDRVRSLRLPESASVGPRTNRLPWLLCLVLVAVVGWLGYRELNRSPDAAPPSPVADVDTQPVATPTAATAPDSGVALESKGYIIPVHQILITPQVSGRIERLHVEEGSQVKKGDILAELEKTDYLADMAGAQALLAAARFKLAELEAGNRPEEIEQVRAELAETETSRDQLYADWQRNQRLRATRAITDREYEQSESQYRAMEYRATRLEQSLKLMIDGPRIERINLAKAEVKQAEAEVTKAQWRLDNCSIRAPVTGTILKKNAEEGNIVNPIAQQGTFSLCEMADLSDLEVELDIQERDISRVHKGQPCKVRPEAFPERVYDGVVSRLMPIALRSKGAIPVRVKLSIPAAEQGVYLKPEMGAVVTFLKEATVEAK